MVTATLTAAAVKSQIACQQQRVQALQATLSTMESGMDKHMLQVSAVARDIVLHGYSIASALPQPSKPQHQQFRQAF
jgi:hypothetical protein